MYRVRRSVARAALIVFATVFVVSSCRAASDAGDAGTVMVTGANHGIGLEFARHYTAAGWQVIGTARKPEAADELRGLGVNVVQLDVTDQASVDRMARDLNGRPIDLLINNAGVLHLMMRLADIDIDQFKRQLAVNAVGRVRVTLAFPIVPPTFGKSSMNRFRARARVAAEDSVKGIRSIVERLTAADNGAFQCTRVFSGDPQDNQALSKSYDSDVGICAIAGRFRRSVPLRTYQSRDRSMDRVTTFMRKLVNTRRIGT